MGDFRAKVVALATLSTVAILAACAPAAEGGPATTAPQSAEASASPSVTPSLEASESPSPTLSPPPTLSPSPTVSPEPRVTDQPTADGDGDAGDAGGGGDGDDEPSGASTWTYRWAPTDGYPTYYPEVLPPTNDDGTVGSGCQPSNSETLPDGVWRGFPTDKSFQEWPAWIEFDIVCSYSFEYDDAPEGQYDWDPYGDWSYTLTNDDPTIFTLPVASDAIGHGTTWDWAPVAWDDTWLGCGPCDTWIWVNDGEVTELAAAYNWPTEWLNDKNGTG